VALLVDASALGVRLPKYAAYLNLLEPWWEVLRSLALKGRRFETWAEACQAVAAATADWHQHRPPWSGAAVVDISRAVSLGVRPSPK
jgi:hypothetical protein